MKQQLSAEQWARIQKEAMRIHKKAIRRERFRAALKRFRIHRADRKDKGEEHGHSGSELEMER